MAKQSQQHVSAEELAKNIVLVQKEFIVADTQYNIHKELLKAIPDYDPAFQISHNFWNYTFDAHINMVVLRLCKLYDTDDATMALPQLLEVIEQNQNYFNEKAFRERHETNPNLDRLCEFPRSLDVKDLENDKSWCNHENPCVKRLVILRNYVIAHANYKVIKGENKVTEKFPLTRGNIETLITKGLSIVNKYANIFGLPEIQDCKTSKSYPKDFIPTLDHVMNYLRNEFPDEFISKGVD